MLPGLDLYSVDPDPAQHLTTADTGCAVDDLDHDLIMIWARCRSFPLAFVWVFFSFFFLVFLIFHLCLLQIWFLPNRFWIHILSFSLRTLCLFYFFAGGR